MDHPPLPEPLTYMQPFADYLSALSPDELVEEVDPGPLEDLLRGRIANCPRHEADLRLARDGAALRRWLDDTGQEDHPAWWIVGFLDAAAAEDLFEPPIT